MFAAEPKRWVVGWSMKLHTKRALVIDALRVARFRSGPEADVIFRSDRGSTAATTSGGH